MMRKRIIGTAALAIAAGALCIALIATGTVGFTSTRRPPDACPASFPRYISEHDADGDGVDDMTDMLEGALAYVNTRPRYRSAYYPTGWPDDGCGVCTDVVAYAMLAAGYDLKDLIADDIAANPDAYAIASPDPAIDFRRVANQRVFLSRHAQALTCSLDDPAAWQGGDIVVFTDHVGIVSDRRNPSGVPYLIHHEGPFQAAFEQDVLEDRSNDIVGHYRLS